MHKILVVIEPLLIDEDYYARVEGREIISNLAKAAGLATMIATMRPDIDNVDEYVRNTTARAFAVVASALGIHSLLPFLKAVCQSKKSWQARHTGIKICQQIAILMGCAILPHLRSLVEIIEHGLEDEQSKVSLTSLAKLTLPSTFRSLLFLPGSLYLRSCSCCSCRSSGSLRNRILRLCSASSVERHPTAPWKDPGGLLESHRLHYPADGHQLRQLLHERGDGGADSPIR